MTVTTIDTNAAERRALRIGIRLDAIADNYEQVVPMIAEALELGDHETLGFRSPGEYLADRFGKALARMPIAIRRETVAAIDSVHPVSTRSLAPVFEVDNATIHRDRQAIAAGVASATPEPAAPNFADGSSEIVKLTGPNSVHSPGTAVDLANVDMETGEIHDAPVQKVTGMDGKTYTRPGPAKPRRRPITDQARDAGYELRKAVERLQRITEDDRLSSNKEQVTALLRGHLLYAVEVCQDLLDHQITQEGA